MMLMTANLVMIIIPWRAMKKMMTCNQRKMMLLKAMKIQYMMTDFDDDELYIGRKFGNVVDLRFCLQQYGTRKNFNFKCIKNDIKRVTA